MSNHLDLCVPTCRDPCIPGRGELMAPLRCSVAAIDSLAEVATES